MNIMNTLTLKHIKKNKARTIVTIIGIIVSVAMLTAVTTGITSCMRWFRNGEIKDSGKWHAEFENVSVDQWQQLRNMKDFEELFATKEVGYAFVGSTEAKNKPYVYICAYDSSALKNMPIKLVEGRLPAKKNELILSKEILGALGNDLKVGDTVSYQLGQRYLKDTGNEKILESHGIVKEKPLTQSDIYLDGTSKLYMRGEESSSNTTASEELRLTGENKTYTVVGFIERPGYNVEPPSAPGYAAFTYLDEKAIKAGGTVNAYCYYRHVTRNIYEDMVKTAKELGMESPTNVNDHVLYYEGISPDSRFTKFIGIMYVSLIAIIVLGSVSLIYNSFAISISERSKQLGMLASVGATKRQKRNCVFYEAFLYGIIGIPLGIISGLVGITIAFRIVSNMIQNSFEIEVPLVTVVSEKTILASVLLAALTIFISAYLPARKASKISAIEAIRQSKDIQIRVSKVRTLWITKKLFGFEGELANKNMKRNRRRYRSIIFALFISVVLFITVSSYLHYVTSAFYMANGMANYDISLMLYPEETFKEEESRRRDNDLAKEIKKIDSITHLTTSYSVSMPVREKELSSYYSDEIKAFMEQQGQLEEEEAPHYINVQSLDDISFDAYCKQNGIDAKKVRATKNGVIILNLMEARVNFTVKQYPIFSVRPGDTFTTMERRTEYENINSTSLTVAATSKELPTGQTEYPQGTNAEYIVIVPEKTFTSIYHEATKDIETDMLTYNSRIYIDTKDNEATYREMESILAENKITSDSYQMENVAKMEQGNRQIMYSMSIFAYGFIILMSMICCTNMCNTVSTSIALRRTEFAMLKSVGMTPKSFSKMIRFESLLYGVKALAYGIPVSLLGSYIIYRYMVGRFTVGFLLPWYIYFIAIVLVFGVVGIAMLYSSRKIRKENIIDGLKNELS